MALPKVTHRLLKRFIAKSYRTYEPLLVTGKPGIGKTVATFDYGDENGVQIIVSHPVISDPTDFKGFPAKATREVEIEDEFAALMEDSKSFTIQDIATFLPFGDLLLAMEATVPTIWFFDDFGQAPMAVQAACMQIIGGRRIGEKKISDHVRIMAATNRREDNAGVKGLLEPVKSRFGMIVELVADRDGMTNYAYQHGWEQSIIDFMNFTPGAIEDFKPSKTMENSPNPRLWGKLDVLIKDTNTHEPEMLTEDEYMRDICSSCIGELYGAQYNAFRSIYKNLPRYNEILAEPDEYPLDQKLDVRMCMLGMLANQVTKDDADDVMIFINRLAKEYQTIYIRSLAAMGKKDVLSARSCVVWTSSNMDIFLH